MTRLPECFLYTQDEELDRRVQAHLGPVASVKGFSSLRRLEAVMDRNRVGILLVDLRSEDAPEALAYILRTWPETVIIALGIPGSEPLIQAESLGLYGVEDVQVPRQRLEALVLRAADHARLVDENQSLRKELVWAAAAKPQPRADASPQPARHFAGAFRRFDNVEALLESAVEGVGAALRIPRAGIFCRRRDGEGYRLRAGLRCLEDTRDLEYTDRDPLVRWLTLHPHLVSRANLEHVRNDDVRLALSQTLDALGASMILPLQSRERLLGWLFVGDHATGEPYDTSQVEQLLSMAEQVSTALENALLYDEIAVQKTLAETVLHSMPTGIVAVDNSGIVRWFNDAAQQILDQPPNRVMNQRAEALGSRLAEALRSALQGEPVDHPDEWTDPQTQRTLSVQTRRLAHRGTCLGAVALIQDMTVERVLQEKEEQIERTAFWTELAASMSHEVRNPLVAIKTFAQLLPERYTEAEFREQFSTIVTEEVDRLSQMTDQINRFAHPRQPEFRPLDVRRPLQAGLDAALDLHAHKGLSTEATLDDNLPMVLGDEQALTECFLHVFSNAIEAVAREKKPRITLSVRRQADGMEAGGVAVTIADNGKGIPADIRGKVFSPFCTTKARGMGLGLPIVKRTVVDHNGRVLIESGDKGTSVRIILPPGSSQRERDEARSDRGRRNRQS